MSPLGCAVHWPCYITWHIYDLCRLKIDQLSFGFPWPNCFVSLELMVVCPWYMHFGVMFCIMMWQRKCIYSVKRGMFVESSLLMNLLIHDSSWISRASSTGKTAYSVSWLLRSSRLVKTRSEVHSKRNNVSIMLFRAELIENFWTAILVQKDKISSLFIVMGMWRLFSCSGSLYTGHLKSFKMTLCMAGAMFLLFMTEANPRPFPFHHCC